ncbi:MAG TPA: hypothetical protein VH392_04820 [Sphingomicrobium sp.]|jgi:hypothetical protein
MAHSHLRPLLIALALLPAACDARHDQGARGSITVVLPPARAAIARPGFSLEQQTTAAQPGDERAAQAVRDVVDSSK